MMPLPVALPWQCQQCEELSLAEIISSPSPPRRVTVTVSRFTKLENARTTVSLKWTWKPATEITESDSAEPRLVPSLNPPVTQEALRLRHCQCHCQAPMHPMPDTLNFFVIYYVVK